MKIQFEKQDAEKILYDSFCNGGLSELYYCGISVDWESNPNSINYTNAKNRLKEKQKENQTICIEDVFVEILKNGDAIIFTDNEDEDGELIELRLDDALNNINSIADEDKIQLAKLLDEDNCDADAWDYFYAIQYALHKEVIYG
jgi:hypothetical protein